MSLTTPTGAAPQSLLARLWTLATLQAKIAVAYLAYWLRKGFAGTDADGRALNEAHLTAALRLVSGMTYLRGPIMKVGQVLATYPNVLPAEYSNALTSLQFHAGSGVPRHRTRDAARRAGPRGPSRVP